MQRLDEVPRRDNNPERVGGCPEEANVVGWNEREQMAEGKPK